jgi:hypothetical protein
MHGLSGDSIAFATHSVSAYDRGARGYANAHRSNQSSHAQEIFYMYITQQAYHDEKVNPTPTHEGRTIVYQEMFSVRSQY